MEMSHPKSTSRRCWKKSMLPPRCKSTVYRLLSMETVNTTQYRLDRFPPTSHRDVSRVPKNREEVTAIPFAFFFVSSWEILLQALPLLLLLASGEYNLGTTDHTENVRGIDEIRKLGNLTCNRNAIKKPPKKDSLLPASYSSGNEVTRVNPNSKLYRKVKKNLQIYPRT